MAILPDVRVALRSLGRAPGFALIAVATLGLGIGANTSAFSILNEVLLKPSPYHDSARLDALYRSTPRNSRGRVSPADYLDLKEAGAYADVAAYGSWDLSLSEPGQPAEMAASLRVSANLFSVLATPPALGRGFRPEEAVPGNHRVLVISHRCWQNRFAGDVRIVGRRVRVDGESHEIVGVLPASFNDWRHLGWVDLFRPLGLSEGEARDRRSTWLRLVGRRATGRTRAQTEELVAAFGRRLAKDFPDVDAAATWHTVPIEETVLDENGPSIFAMLIGLSGFVLLIACSNLANLMLARTMARAREFALRTALGASRLRLLLPLVAESLTLALAGGIVAIYVARWTAAWLAVSSVGDNGEGVVLALDWHVLLWAFGACLFTAVAFGVGPALFALRLDANATLKSGGRGISGDRGHRRFRHGLIVGQFALALVLIAGAGLFARGLHEVSNRRRGWESDGLVTATWRLPAATYASRIEVAEFQRMALERLEALPGVNSASLSYTMPFFGLAEPRQYVVAGLETPERGRGPSAQVNGVSPHYFATVGTRVLAGRAFDERDALDAPRVFIVNQALARGLFGHESALGRRIAQAGGATVEWGEIVGVVGDVHSVRPDRVAVPYQVYQPMAQEPWHYNHVAVRTAGDAPAALVAGIRKTMAALDADLPLRQLQPVTATIARANYQLGVLGSLLSFLAALGLGLASLGIYGVITRVMAERTSEFGIRLALGAQVGDIVTLVLAAGGKLATVGAALGLCGAFGIARLIGAAFPGMPPSSATVLAGVTLLLAAVALIASYVPARQAARIDPIETLRAE